MRRHPATARRASRARAQYRVERLLCAAVLSPMAALLGWALRYLSDAYVGAVPFNGDTVGAVVLLAMFAGGCTAIALSLLWESRP